jgi:acetylornithine deacetylase
MSAQEDVVDLLGRLVAINSVNPSLVPGAAGEPEIVQLIARWAGDAGLQVEVVGGSGTRPSVLVHGGRRAGGRTLVLCGHVDTVGLGQMDDPLTPRIEGDRMYGRGAYDMKAGLAAALVACREVAAGGLRGEVVVAAVADEEHSSLGAQQVLENLRADGAVVLEPTELVVATAHKGFAWTEITVRGRAAHGSRPHLGVDAILKTGPLLVALQDLDRQLARHEHPTLGPGSLHGSLIAGGTEESTIPDRCTLTVERRTLPGETLADVEREVAMVLDRCRSGDPELEVTSRTTLYRDAFEVSSDEPVVQAVTSAAAAALGRAPAIGGVSYWADSALFAAAGIPTVLFGPGGEGAHADVEWVSLDDTIACVRTLVAAAGDFCG